MNWNRNYHYYLIFGDASKENEPWTKDTWMKVEPLFEKILKHSPHFKETGLGTVQYSHRPNSQYYDLVKFGKLSWNEQSHNKWTIQNINKGRLFAYLDSWTPRRTICVKLDSAPDVFFSLGNERRTYKEKSQFDFLVSIAIVDNLNADIENEVIEISKLINAKRAVYRQRQWNGDEEATKSKTWEFINSIQDVVTSFGIYRAGPTLNIHDTKFADIKFEPYWETIYCR